jgi:hypothetical protein
MGYPTRRHYLEGPILPQMPTGMRVWRNAALPVTNAPTYAGVSAAMWSDPTQVKVITDSACPWIVVPMWTDLRGDDTCGAGLGDVVEFPQGTAVYYRILSVIDQHKAQPNEFRLALVTRVAPFTYPQK